MKFGKLEHLAGVDLSLPDDDAATARVLAAGPRRAAPTTCRIGLPRWADRGLVGTLYPPGTPAKGYLAAYATQFDTIELNATYYRTDASSISRWAEQTPPSFRFCPKLTKTISHNRMLSGTELETARFVDAIEGFGERLGPAWILLPEAFGPDRRDVLEGYTSRWPSHVPLAVELRHPDWFGTDSGRVVFDHLAAHGVAAIITDVAGRRDVLHQRLTTRTAIVRFVGTGEPDLDLERAEAWSDCLIRWSSQGLEEAYVFLHQPDEHRNVPIARRLAGRLAAGGVDVKEPAPASLLH